MTTEITPLLGSPNCVDIYSRFSARDKRIILTVVSGCGVLPFFVSGTLTPALPRIAKELGSTGEVINLSVSISILALSLGSLVGATFSTVYGRRPIYLWSLPVCVVGSIGVTSSNSICTLFFWRFIQSLGSSPSGVVGLGVIGDIFKVEERGRAMCVFFAATLMGPAIAPVAGGYATRYYSWRAMQSALGAVAFIAYCAIVLYLQETSHNICRKETHEDVKGETKARNFKFVNPLRPLWLLRSPPFFMIAIVLSICVAIFFAQIIPLTYSIGKRYNIHNEAWVGACFIPSGIGNIVGAMLIGPVSDRMVINWTKKRGGVWYPEDRLRAALFPLVVIIPGSILVLGLTDLYVDGTFGLAMTLMCLFVNGMGNDMVIGPCSAYLVDVMQSRSAESLAANTAFRALIISMAIAAALPMVNHFGVFITNLCCAVLVWISYGFIWLIISRGEQLRKWVDVGYSTTSNLRDTS